MGVELFSADDKAVLAQSMGREPDDGLLARLLATARGLAAEHYAEALRVYPQKRALYDARVEEYAREYALWAKAAEAFDQRSRRYDAELAQWRADPNRAERPVPAPPVDPGAAPVAPEAPAEPIAPTDAEAVIMLMDAQRAALERAASEERSEPSIDLEIERAEIVNEAFDLVMSRLGRREREAEERKFPASLGEKLSDWGEIAADKDLTQDDLMGLMREDADSAQEVIGNLSKDQRRRFTELLNVELAELQQVRGAAGENLKREADIEQLLGLFARVGEM